VGVVGYPGYDPAYGPPSPGWVAVVQCHVDRWLGERDRYLKRQPDRPDDQRRDDEKGQFRFHVPVRRSYGFFLTLRGETSDQPLAHAPLVLPQRSSITRRRLVASESEEH
jgi:hypothetical protein